MKDIHIHVVDDDDSVRNSLQFMLESYDFPVVVYHSGDDFLQRADISQAGCVILDSNMPGLSGQQVHLILNEKNSPLSVVYLTGQGDVPMAVDAFKKGAIDFFQKPVNGDALAETLNVALRLSAQRKQLVEYQLLYAQLTDREKSLFTLVAEGYKNQQISETLHIAVRTVEVHRSNLMRKLGVKSLAELVSAYAFLIEKV